MGLFCVGPRWNTATSRGSQPSPTALREWGAAVSLQPAWGERAKWARFGHFSANITDGNLGSWYLLWGAEPECSDPGWSLWGDLWTLSLVCTGGGLARCQVLSVLLKKKNKNHWIFLLREILLHSPLGKRGNQQCANFMPGISLKRWASAGRNALPCVCL